jgi:heavy metal sensor kinase
VRIGTHRIRSTVRVRLKLWYTALLALILVAFALVSYGTVAQTVRRSTDNSLLETSDDFVETLRTEIEFSEGRNIAKTIALVASDFRYKDRRVDLYDSLLNLVASSDDAAEEGISAGRRPLLSPSGRQMLVGSQASPLFVTLENRRGAPERRVLARAADLGGSRFFVVVTRSLAAQEDVLQQTREAFYLAIPLSLLIASFSGYFLAFKSLQPVVRMSSQAARIRATNLHERIEVANQHDELGKLAAVLNDLLQRLERSFQQQHRLMADASHELRTPIAIVRGEAEVALSRESRSESEYRETLAIIHDEARRMTQVVESLFTIARADAGQIPVVRANFFLEELAFECLRSLRSIAGKKGIQTDFSSSGEMPIDADEGLLQRMLLNLIENGIKYTPPGGNVRVDLQRRGDFYEVRVSDSGEGITAAARPHIFEPFYRADKSRSRAETGGGGSGAGLGLPIARWIAEVHGGSLTLESTSDQGSTFLALIPAVEGGASGESSSATFAAAEPVAD